MVAGGFLYWNRPAARLRRQVDFWVHDSCWALPVLKSIDLLKDQKMGWEVSNALQRIERTLAVGSTVTFQAAP